MDSAENALYRNYETAAAGDWLYRAIIESYFPQQRNSRILDLGCGNGSLLKCAEAMGYSSLRGVDRSPRQIAGARAAYISEGNLLEFVTTCPERSQDVVCTYDVLEHLTLEQNMALAREVWRILEIGGRWLIHTVNGASPMAGRVLFGDLTHNWAFTPDSLRQLLLNAGFTEINFFEDRPVVHGPRSLIRAVLWRVVRLLPLAWLATESGITKAILTQNFVTLAFRR